jgi:hypothetical protein
MALDELGHQGRLALRLPLALAVLAAKTVPFHVPPLAQPLPAGLEPGRIRGQRAPGEHPDPGQGLRLLLSGERHPEDAEGKGGDDPAGAEPHGGAASIHGRAYSSSAVGGPPVVLQERAGDGPWKQRVPASPSAL